MKPSLLAGIFLGIAGLTANCFPLELSLNVNFYFGSLFVMVALLLHGGRAALLAGIIALSAAWSQWQPSWAVVFTMAEILFVTWRLRRGSRNIIISDTVYWCCLGAPLSWLLYRYLPDFQALTTQLLILKQAVNGVVNALLANVVWISLKMARKDSAQQLPSIQEIIFTATLGLISVPTILCLVVNQHQLIQAEAKELAEDAAHEAYLAKIAIRWVLSKQPVEAAGDADKAPRGELLRGAQLAELRSMVATIAGEQFHHLSLLDGHGKVIVSTRRELPPMSLFRILPGNQTETLSVGKMRQRVAPDISAPGKQPIHEQQTEEAEWKVVAEISTAPMIEELARETMNICALIILLLALTSLFAHHYSRTIAATFLRLRERSSETPSRIRESEDNSAFPPSGIREVNELFDNFLKMEQALRVSFREADELNATLAARVREIHEISSQLALQNELEDKRRFLRTLLDAIPDSVFIKDLNGVFLGCNTAFAIKYIGRPQDQIIGRTYREMVPDEKPALHVQAQDSEVITTGRSHAKNEQIPLADGRHVWAETILSPFRDSEEKIIGIIGVSREMTDRIELMRELESSRNNMQMVLDNLPLLAWLKDKDGRYKMVNKNFVKAVGKPISKIIGFTDLDVWPREPAEKFRADDQEVMDTGGRKRLEERVSDQYGDTWHETFKTAITDEKGQIQGTAGVALSITDRKNAEEATLKILSLQTATLEATADGILVVDRTGRWSTHNKKFLELWRIPETVATRNDLRVLRRHALPQLNDPVLFMAKVKELYDHPEESSMEIITFKDGRVYERYSQPQHLGAEIVGRVWSFRDITRRVEIERELTASREAAESANKLKSLFLANMSHELRTPLNAVIGLGYLLQQTELSLMQRDYLNKMDQAAHSLMGIINDILDLSRIEAGELHLEEIDFSLVESLKRVLTLMEGQAEAKGLDLHVSIKDSVPEFLRGDSFRLEQVLINLLNNAVKFTHKGCVTLSAESGSVEGELPMVVTFSVRDSGIGLTSQQITGLFRPFSQVDPSMTRRYGGSGLGLSICKRLITLMNGDISVTSVPDEGSTFTFTAQFNRTTAMPAKQPEAEPLQLRQLGGARILVVEDNEVNLLIMEELLMSAGIRVETAANGREAIAAIAAAGERFDLVFMDIQMPVMDGHEATRLIREEWPAAELPIIAMTAHALKEEVQKCLDAGMNDHLAKPIEVTALHHKLRRWISPPAAELREPEPTPDEPVAGALLQENRHPPVLDSKEAMARLDISLDKYLKIVALAGRTHENDAVLLQKELAAGNEEAAYFLIHTLRGVAANISAPPLTEAVTALEAVIKSGEPEKAWQQFLPAVESTLTAVMAKIRELTATVEVRKAEEELASPPLLTTQLKMLLLLLAEQDLEAQKIFAHLAPCLKARNPLLTADLTKKIEQLDFIGAGELLRDFAEGEHAGLDE